MRRNAVRDGCFYGVQGDDPRDVCDAAEGDDVGKERLADFFDGERRDGDGDDMCRRRDVRHELAVHDEDALRGIEVAGVLIRRRLCHGEDDVRMLDMRMIDHVVADDDLGAGRAAARLRTIGL